MIKLLRMWMRMAWRIPLLAAFVVAYSTRALSAAPDAAFVMDARTGEVLLAENAETPLHPASLTKMMTLYVVFSALDAGEIAWDARVTVSPKAASTGGSRMGLRAGQQVAIGDLVRATAVQSANDASVALAEAVAGDQAGFVVQMNALTAAMGLRGTSFRNAHGLTAQGHLSTARDMSLLGWRLLWDFPEFAGLYARVSADIAGRTVAHTNRRFLNAYAGADGIKTGYTRAAGFTLTSSAQRGGKHLIVTVLGAPSSAERAARAGKLMDWGFDRVAEDVRPRPPPPLNAPSPPHGGEAVPALLAAAQPLYSAPRAPLIAGRSGMLAPVEAPASLAHASDTPRQRPGGLALTALSGSGIAARETTDLGLGVAPPAALDGM